MHRLRTTVLLLSPSLLSGMATVLLALVVIIISGASYVSENQLFYDYLFGPQGVNTILLQAPDNFSAIADAIMSSSFTYYTLLVTTAVMAGLTVFAVLRGIANITASVHSFQQARIEQKEAIQEIFQRLSVRILSFMAAALYWIFFVSAFVPFDLLLLQMGIESFGQDSPLKGVAAIAASYLLLILGLHLHIVFIRLCALRLRLFGGYDAQMAAIKE